MCQRRHEMVIKRNWLKKQVELGKVAGKCDYSMTDDYAFDNANDFGKTKWLPVRIRHPKFETTTLQNGNEVSHLADHDVKDDYLNLNDFDFASRTGRAYRDGDEISLHV